jgi:hypothetical protein
MERQKGTMDDTKQEWSGSLTLKIMRSEPMGELQFEAA